MVPVVPLTAKSAAATFWTSSLKVARNTSASAFVFSAVGVFRVNDVVAGSAGW